MRPSRLLCDLRGLELSIRRALRSRHLDSFGPNPWPLCSRSDTLISLPVDLTSSGRSQHMPAIKFRGVDFIDFDTLLSDDERLVRDTARKFIEENLIPIIEECNRAGRFPRELVK